MSIRLPTSRPEAPPPQPDPPPREAPAPDRPELDLGAQAEALDRRADELVAAARRIAELEVQCSRLEAELAATREQVPDPGRIEELQTELGRLRRENGTLRDRLSTAQTERDAAVARADDHEAHVGRLEAELVAVRKQAIDPAEVEIARIELGRARHENQKLREELAAAQAPARHRSHDSHSLLLPAEDGYRQLYRSGPAPEPGEQVELPGRDGSGSRILTVVRTATGPSGTTCAYLAEL